MSATWIVWSPTGPSNPRFRHSTRQEARAAARSMAQTHRGQTFYVCRCTDSFVAQDVSHVDLVLNSDEIPF